MASGGTRPIPWKSWADFWAWAQDFSLRKKVLGGFLGVVVLVGVVTAFIGTRLVHDTIFDRAKKSLSRDLATAQFVLDELGESVELKIQLSAGSETLAELLKTGDLQGIRNRLAVFAVEHGLDFLTVASTDGKILARAFVTSEQGGDASAHPLFKNAAAGKVSSGVRSLGIKVLKSENPNLVKSFTNKDITEGMVFESAQPVIIDKQIKAVVYGGVLINNNTPLVDRIAQLIFKGEVYNKKAIGFVSIFQGYRTIATTLKGKDGRPLSGTSPQGGALDSTLERGETSLTGLQVGGDAYLSGAAPIRDLEGKIIGAVQLATLEKPITTVIDRLVFTFLIVALMGVLLMGAISYFLVQWINRPLELILNAARRAADGDLTHEVPVVARDEVGQLAASFNVMIRSLAESRRKLEEWGTELASKVASQAGELIQAREQVARVKKLASLEKMADGMAQIMMGISDPLVRPLPESGHAGGSTMRVLVLDDNERDLEICERILENEGFEVILARTVKEALQELQEEFVDLVIANVDMPDMGGKELFKEIRYRQPDVIVIFTAPFKASAAAVEAVELGAFDYVPKPFGPHQILLTAYTALQTRLMIDQTRKQHAEQRAETIFQRLPVAIALADKEHRVVYNNSAFLELTSGDSGEPVRGKTFKELFGVDPLEYQDSLQDPTGARWCELEKVGRTAKLYNFKLHDEDLRVLMLLDVTETVQKTKQADVFKTETISKAHQVIHQQMRVAQEIAGLLGETTAETKAALFELIKLADELGEAR